jgi:hypothetical protein
MSPRLGPVPNANKILIFSERYDSATFIPTTPPAFNIFPCINLNLFHNIHYIIITVVQLKQENRPRIEQNNTIMETTLKTSEMLMTQFYV